MGNSAEVAAKHYLRTYDQHYTAAVELNAPTDAGQKVAHKVAHQAPERGCKAAHASTVNDENPRDSEGLADSRRSGRDSNPRWVAPRRFSRPVH
jgi:hypothetical protein